MKTMNRNTILSLLARALALATLMTAAGCALETEIDPPAPEQITLVVEENGGTATKAASSGEKSFVMEIPGGEVIPVSITSDIPTRGEAINNSDNTLKAIWLWAYMAGDGSCYIDGNTLDNSGSVWETGHYWPSDRSLSFLACGTGAETLGFDPEVSYTSPGILNCSFDYEVAKGSGEYAGKDAEVQADILLGMTFDRNAEGGYVPVTMHHALSAVRFIVGNMPYGITLKSISFTNVYSKARCSASGELALLSYSWSNHGVKQSYSQSFDQFMVSGDDIGGKEQTFMLIPQEFTTDEAELEIGFNIQDRPYVLKKSLKSIIPDSRLEPDRRYTFRIGIPDEVDIEVEDDVAGNVKSNVKITNTGFGPGYVRMALVGNWVNSHGIIIAPWLESDGEFVGWNPDWVQRSDGFYYYKNVLLGGETAPAPFDKYTVTTKDHNGQTLYLSVMTQIVHPSSMTIWPSRPAEWVWPLSTP